MLKQSKCENNSLRSEHHHMHGVSKSKTPANKLPR